MSQQHTILSNILALSEQATWDRTIALGHETLDVWIETLDSPAFARIYFVGCGTSFYAGQVAKYVTEHIAGIAAESGQAFAFATYAEPAVLGPDTLVVGISTTGGSEAVVEALTHARAHNASTLAVTATAGSPVTEAAHATVLTGGDDDKVSVKTKSYVQSLVTLYLLAAKLALANGNGGSDPVAYWEQQIQRAAAATISFLDQNQTQVADLAMQYVNAGKIFVLGSGPNCGTAEEGSLKVIEMAKIYSEAQELEDFLHGRFREVDQASPMLFVAPHGRASERILDFLVATSAVKAPTIVLTDNVTQGIEQLANYTILMPGNLDEYTTPLLYIVPLHLFAYHLAVGRGYDPGARRYNIVPQKMRFRDLANV